MTLHGRNFGVPIDHDYVGGCENMTFTWDMPFQIICYSAQASKLNGSAIPYRWPLTISVGTQLSNSSIFHYFDVTAVSPRYGNVLGGETLVIHGHGFTDRMAVHVDVQAGKGTDCIVYHSHSLTVSYLLQSLSVRHTLALPRSGEWL